MADHRTPLRLLVIGLSGMTLAACGASGSNGLTSADIPSFLGVQANSAAFTTVAGGAGLDAALPVGPHEKCPAWYHSAFVPPGRHGEAAAGEGVPITYPEILIITWRCPSIEDARTGFQRVLIEHHQTVNEVGDQAEILNRTDDANDGYPDSRVFFVGWRTGNTLGALELAGPDSDRRITAALTETLASRAAQS